MDTYLAIASRRDERRYRPSPLPPDVVDRILDAGRLCGSARNRQPWLFLVVETRLRIDALAAAVFVPENVRAAGLVVAVVVSGGGPTLFDAGRATQNILLAAWNEGISSCPNGIADQGAAAEALDLAEGEQAVIVLSFGLPERAREPEARTPAEWSARANRKAIAEVVRRV